MIASGRLSGGKAVVYVAGLVLLGVALLSVIGGRYSPSNQMSAAGPACRLLPAGPVHQALQTYGLLNLDNHEEGPVNYHGTPADVCGYFENEIFGRGGYESARLYVASFSSVVSPQQVIGDLFKSWLGLGIAYSIEPYSGVGDELSPVTNMGPPGGGLARN